MFQELTTSAKSFTLFTALSSNNCYSLIGNRVNALTFLRGISNVPIILPTINLSLVVIVLSFNPNLKSSKLCLANLVSFTLSSI